jgi:hypothetical protein
MYLDIAENCSFGIKQQSLNAACLAENPKISIL